VCVCELPQTSTPHLNHPQRPLPPLLAPLQLRACRFQTLWTNGVDNATGSEVWGMGPLLRSVLNGDAFFIAFCFGEEGYGRGAKRGVSRAVEGRNSTKVTTI